MKRILIFRFYLIIILMAVISAVNAQKKVIAYDFESPLDLRDWYVANNEITMSQCGSTACPQLPGSAKCLRIQWDHVPENKPGFWFSDIKIDTFGNEAMEKTWENFKENTWLIFKVNTAGGDSVYFQFIVFTKDEKDKWGSHQVIGVKSSTWTTVKVKLSDLQYYNWGKGSIPAPDFKSIIPTRIEIGLRSAKADEKGKIDVRLDDFVISNYEP
ncbi:MAG: hypothetical protein ABIN97_04195 [Ginsengibacter sp.]